jgi:tetratricopeptide (TPR) repeat protein
MSINNMGLLLHDQGKLADAEPYYREALEQSRRVLGDGHLDTLVSMNNMGYLLKDQRKLAEARLLYAEATQVARARLGDHLQTACLEHHYADVLRELGCLDEAIDLARAAVDRYRAHPEWSAREAAHALLVLADALGGAGRQAEGLAATWEWIQVIRHLPGKAPIELASNLATFAADATAAGDPALLERAEEALRDCLKIRATELPDDHPKVWLRYNAMSMLGGVLVARAADPGLEVGARLARLREAEPLVLRAWEHLEDDPNVPPASATGGSCRRRAALERIVSLYDGWHSAEPSTAHDGEAARWRAELEKLSTPSNVQADPTRRR